MRRQGTPPLNLTNYNPDKHELPPNRMARRALASRDRKLKKAGMKRATALSIRLERALAPLVAQPLTEEVRAEMVRVTRRILNCGAAFAEDALKAALKDALVAKLGVDNA